MHRENEYCGQSLEARRSAVQMYIWLNHLLQLLEKTVLDVKVYLFQAHFTC